MTPEGVYAPGGATHRRSPGHGPRALSLVYARTRELYPSSIRSSTPCRGAASTSGGEPDTVDHRRAEAQPRSKPPRLANPALVKHENVGSAGPRTAACADRPRRPPAIHGRRRRTWQLRLEPACANRAYTPGTVGRSNRLRSPTTQGLGPASHGAPRRATRSAMPEVLSIDQPPALALGSRPELLAGRVLSTACHQPVESTRRLFRLSLVRLP